MDRIHWVYVCFSMDNLQETDNALDDLAVAPQSTIKLVRSAGVKISFNNAQFTSLAVIGEVAIKGNCLQRTFQGCQTFHYRIFIWVTINTYLSIFSIHISGTSDQELFAGRDDGGVLHMSRHAALKFPKNYMARPPGNDTTEGEYWCTMHASIHIYEYKNTSNYACTFVVYNVNHDEQ